ncbi:hypothetical protein IFR05_008322 [Cadophora sp. M221]|nr:hypothetical protein IFR05_008322 [Cadophora sp. M221]
MSITALEEPVLCELCKQIQDLDRLVTSGTGIDHHKSWTELCKSAEEGCQLCDAFVRGQEIKRPRSGPEPLPQNFDQQMKWPDTQLTIMPHGRNGLFILEQEKLFRHPFLDVASLWIEFYTQPSDPLTAVFNGRGISSSSSSDESFALLSKWIETCRRSHPLCSWSHDNPLPTRVVDVGSEYEDPFLFESNGATGEWVTLSHCWGGEAPLATTSESLEQHKSSIPMDTLPQNFKDAISLTRELGFQYIWIDSLCIIQNIHEDWTSESSQMHRVYTNASLNISAAAAKSPKEGIFESSNKLRHFGSSLFSLPCKSEKKEIHGVVDLRIQLGGGCPFIHLPDEPLHRRAWVLQESVLSPRRIDFGSSQLFWECRTALHTERYPESTDGESFFDASGRVLHQMEPTRMDPLPNLPRHFRGSNADNPVSWWYRMLLNSYCRRGVTDLDDLLPALAGVAEEVSNRTGYHYKAGLWLEDILRGLLWQPLGSMVRPEQSHCPSWTWASTQLPWHDRHLSLYEYGPNFRASVIEANIVNASKDDFGQVISGYLKLEANYKSFKDWESEELLYNKREDHWHMMKIYYRRLSKDNSTRYAVPDAGHVLCTLDQRLETVDGCHLTMIERGAICVQIASFLDEDFSNQLSEMLKPGDEVEKKVTVHGLILEPTGTSDDEYRRIGIVEIAAEDGLADNWATKIFTIV